MAKSQLPAVVVRLGWISFFADVCSELVYPIVPIFLTSIGTGPAAIGLVEGVATAIVSLMKGYSGFRTDATGQRTRFIQVGYLLSGMAKPMIGFAGSWPLVLGARSMDRFGKGIRTTPRDALITDSVDKDQYGHAFGFHQMMDTAGAIAGSLICLGIIRFLPGLSGRADPITSDYRLIFWLAGIPGLTAFLITLSLPAKVFNVPAGSSGPFKVGRSYVIALVAMTLFGLANSSDMFLLLRSMQGGFSLTQMILAYVLFNFTYTVVSSPVGKWSDIIGRRNLLAFGFLLYAVTYLAFAYLGGSAMWFLFALYGVSFGVTAGLSKAFIADFAPKDGKGRALGTYYLTTGLASLLASAIAGVLWEQFGAPAAFLFGFGTALAATIVLFALPSGPAALEASA